MEVAAPLDHLRYLGAEAPRPSQTGPAAPSLNIRCLQVNAQHAKQAQHEINRWIDQQRKGSYIVMVQEPYLYKERVAMQPLNGSKYSSRNKARTAIYTNKEMGGWYLEHLSHKDATVVVAKIKNRTTVIASVYLDYNENNPVIPGWLEDIVRYAESKGYGLLIGMDSNCHSTLYGNSTNSRGEALEDFIAQNQLYVENIGLVPTFQTKWGSSIIDITLTKRLAVSVLNWRVYEGYNGSDHNSIEYDVCTDIREQKQQLLLHKADWEVFASELDSRPMRLPSEMTEQRLEKCVLQFYRAIDKSLKKACPLGQVKERDQNNPWWTKQLQQQRSGLNKLYRRRKQSDQHWKDYKDAEENYRKACRKAKEYDWEGFVEGQQNNESINKLRKILEANVKQTLGVMQKADGTHTEPGSNTLQYLLEAHFPSIQSTVETKYTEVRKQTREINELELEWLTVDKLKEVFKLFKNKKSPGPDGLRPTVLKQLSKNKIEELIFLYKTTLMLEFTPTKWKESNIIWIPKPHKDRYNHHKSWRPISLSNYVVKTLEKLITWEVDRVLKENPLSSNQHGFRREKNTETAISANTDYIEKHIMFGKPVVGVFLDIQAAFDTIHPECIRGALEDKGVDSLITNWYYDYLTHRNVVTEYNNEVARGTISVGFPQGGVCSAKFWIIAFNKAMEIINQLGIKGTGFADDCSLLLHREDPQHAVDILNRVLKELTDWGRTVGLTFNPQKTVAIFFTRSNKIQLPGKVRVDGYEVEYSTNTRYLGVQLDSKLSWGLHFDNVATRAKQYLMQLMGVLSKRWGPKPKLVRWVYISIVRARLAYAAIIWSHNINFKTKLNKLKQINRLASMMMVPARRSTPTKALEIINNLMPLDLFLHNQAVKAYNRHKKEYKLDWEGRNPNRPTLVGHRLFWANLSNRLLGKLEATDTIVPKVLENDFKVIIDDDQGREKPKLSQINVFTDGSKSDTGVGAGYVVMKGKHTVIQAESIRLSKDASIFQAEAIAVQQAAAFLYNHFSPSYKYVRFFTDSQAVLLAIQNRQTFSNTIMDTKVILNEVANKVNTLRLHWIKAHVGFEGNELADEYAKEGAWHSTIYIETQLSRKHLDNIIDEKCMQHWATQWEKYPHCRQTKNFYPYPSKIKYEETGKLSRSSLATLVKIVTGQNNLNYLTNIIFPELSGLCRFCEEEDESFIHLVNECPVFLEKRIEIFKDEWPIENSLAWTPSALVDFAYHPPIAEALAGRSNE